MAVTKGGGNGETGRSKPEDFQASFAEGKIRVARAL